MKVKTRLSKKELQKRKKEQFDISVRLGYFTHEEVENYLKSKEASKKVSNQKKLKKPIIFLGYNTNR
jgi:hypothetical protein